MMAYMIQKLSFHKAQAKDGLETLPRATFFLFTSGRHLTVKLQKIYLEDTAKQERSEFLREGTESENASARR